MSEMHLPSADVPFVRTRLGIDGGDAVWLLGGRIVFRLTEDELIRAYNILRAKKGR